MVGKILAIRDLENFSRRSSIYVNPDCDKFFELPLYIAASSNDLTTKCQCFQLSPGKCYKLENSNIKIGICKYFFGHKTKCFMARLISAFRKKDVFL